MSEADRDGALFFSGKQVAHAILLRHDKWPLRFYINYPLIPLSLILARTPLADSLLPFIPLTHVLTVTSPPLFRSAPQPGSDVFGLDSLALTWPPSPTLTLCALPWLRLGYLSLRKRIFALALGKAAPNDGLVGFLTSLIGPVMPRDGALANNDEEGPGGNFEAEVDVELVGEAQAEAGQVDGGDAGAVVRPGRLRIGLGRFTSLLVGALLSPLLAKGAGAALLWLATRNGGKGNAVRALQKVLGISSLVGAGAAARMPWSLLSGSSARTAAVDPVWVRNLVGGELE